MLHKIIAALFVWPMFCAVALVTLLFAHGVTTPVHQEVPFSTSATEQAKPYVPLVNADLDAKLSEPSAADAKAAKTAAKATEAAKVKAEKAAEKTAKAKATADAKAAKAQERADAKAAKDAAKAAAAKAKADAKAAKTAPSVTPTPQH